MTLEQAKALIGKAEPAGRKQVVISEWTGLGWIRVAIGRYFSRKKYREFRITPVVTGAPKPRTWPEALQLAIGQAEQQIKIQPGQPVVVTLTGEDLKVWERLKDIALSLELPLPELPDFLLFLIHKNKQKENTHA